MALHRIAGMAWHGIMGPYLICYAMLLCYEAPLAALEAADEARAREARGRPPRLPFRHVLSRTRRPICGRCSAGRASADSGLCAVQLTGAGGASPLRTRRTYPPIASRAHSTSPGSSDICALEGAYLLYAEGAQDNATPV